MITSKGFNRRTFDEILAGYRSISREIFGEDVDLSNTSPLGLFLQVIAWEQMKVEERAEVSYRNISILTAEGVALDNLLNNLGEERKKGSKAVGTVVFEGTFTELKKGALVSTEEGLTFKTLQEATPDTETPIEAIEIGDKYNVLSGDINTPITLIEGLEGVKNAKATSGGSDIETDNDFRFRVLYKLREPLTGSNLNQYEVWAREVEGVGSVKALATTPREGFVTVIITDKQGEEASEDLISRTKKFIDTVRDVNAGVIVASAKIKNVMISADVIIAKGVSIDEVKEEADRKIKQYFNKSALELDYVSYAQIQRMILEIDGVLDIKELFLNGAKDNLELENTEVPNLKELNLSGVIK